MLVLDKLNWEKIRPTGLGHRRYRPRRVKAHNRCKLYYGCIIRKANCHGGGGGTKKC